MAHWKTEKNWTYEYFDKDTQASEFGEFQSLVDLWNSKRIGSTLPKWSDFDFFDFKGWHGKLSKFSISYDPFDYSIDLYGSDFVDALGKDWTGHKGSEMNQEHVDSETEWAFYEMTTKNAYITRVSGATPYKGMEHRDLVIVELPMSDDGVTVTHTLEAVLG